MQDDGHLPYLPTSGVATGRISWFGGPDDDGVKPDEGLALFEPRDLRDPQHVGLFLEEQPPKTTGLARRLDPQQYYVACRWNYRETPRAWLRHARVRVSANGKSILARPADWGPNVRTGRVADASPAVLEDLGVETDDIVTVEVMDL